MVKVAWATVMGVWTIAWTGAVCFMMPGVVELVVLMGRTLGEGRRMSNSWYLQCSDRE